MCEKSTTYRNKFTEKNFAATTLFEREASMKEKSLKIYSYDYGISRWSRPRETTVKSIGNAWHISTSYCAACIAFHVVRSRAVTS
jgi:hypothetical protein